MPVALSEDSELGCAPVGPLVSVLCAEADISVATSEDVFLVPNTALRFDPEVARNLGKEDDGKEKTLVESLSSRPRFNRGGPAKARVRSEGPSVWVLKDGNPVELLVETGLTDGRFTEATGEGLKEGLPLIVTAKPAPKP